MPVSELAIGMQVVKLDRSWLETAFKLQGFCIKSDLEIRQLAKYCKHVYVDMERSTAVPHAVGERVTLSEDGEVVGSGGESVTVVYAKARERTPEGKAALPPPAQRYDIETAFTAEFADAKTICVRTKDTVKAFMQDVRQAGKADLAAVEQCADEFVASILRNPDPAMLIRALSDEESFSYRHCVHSAILGVALARELGLRRLQIKDLTIGILLADLGKMRLPMELLRCQRRLERAEVEIIELHVKFGLEIAENIKGMSASSMAIIGAHHERFNGSGYPKGLSGGDIPLFGRTADLADAFDAITSERAYARPIPAHEAVQEMYASTVDVFQRELLECLIRVLGTYPVGSMVELSDGAAAMAMALNRERRLLPSVAVLSDKDKRPLARAKSLDLAAGGGAPYSRSSRCSTRAAPASSRWGLK